MRRDSTPQIRLQLRHRPKALVAWSKAADTTCKPYIKAAAAISSLHYAAKGQASTTKTVLTGVS